MSKTKKPIIAIRSDPIRCTSATRFGTGRQWAYKYCTNMYRPNAHICLFAASGYCVGSLPRLSPPPRLSRQANVERLVGWNCFCGLSSPKHIWLVRRKFLLVFLYLVHILKAPLSEEFKSHNAFPNNPPRAVGPSLTHHSSNNNISRGAFHHKFPDLELHAFNHCY